MTPDKLQLTQSSKRWLSARKMRREQERVTAILNAAADTLVAAGQAQNAAFDLVETRERRTDEIRQARQRRDAQFRNDLAQLDLELLSTAKSAMEVRASMRRIELQLREDEDRYHEQRLLRVREEEERLRRRVRAAEYRSPSPQALPPARSADPVAQARNHRMAGAYDEMRTALQHELQLEQEMAALEAELRDQYGDENARQVMNRARTRIGLDSRMPIELADALFDD